MLPAVERTSCLCRHPRGTTGHDATETYSDLSLEAHTIVGGHRLFVLGTLKVLMPSECDFQLLVTRPRVPSSTANMQKIWKQWLQPAGGSLATQQQATFNDPTSDISTEKLQRASVPCSLRPTRDLESP